MWALITGWFTKSILPNLQAIGIAVAVVAVFGMGFYLRNLSAERDIAQQRSTYLQTQIDAQAAKFRAQNRALETQITNERADNATKEQIELEIAANKGKTCPVAPIVRDVIKRLR